MTRSALVTGATGFIGGKLARRLTDDGWTVHAVVRPSSDPGETPRGVRAHIYDGTMERMASIVGDASPDVVFHLASLYLADHRPDQVEALIASNILLPAQLAQAMADAGAGRLVNTGTASQHFGGPGYNPLSLYAATKQACADLLRFYHASGGLSVLTLKIFDTFGAGDTRRKLVQLIVDAAVSGERLDMSPGEQVLDLTHVDDIIDAFLVSADRLLAQDAPLFEEFLLSGERHSVRELVPLVEAAVGGRVDAHFGARPYRAREVMVPVEALAKDRLPGWRPRRGFAASVADLAKPGVPKHSGAATTTEQLQGS